MTDANSLQLSAESNSGAICDGGFVSFSTVEKKTAQALFWFLLMMPWQFLNDVDRASLYDCNIQHDLCRYLFVFLHSPFRILTIGFSFSGAICPSVIFLHFRGAISSITWVICDFFFVQNYSLIDQRSVRVHADREHQYCCLYLSLLQSQTYFEK